MNNFFPDLIQVAEGEKIRPFGFDMSIESMSTQNFSAGMFYFLIFGIIVFLVIASLFMFKDKTQKLKTGEKLLFIMILAGVVVAIVFGAAQMMHGFLV
ncbi:MAG: hypothetical protein L0Z73_14985 [Gammaproteobacteria bacterium]|nr:hypothetical protein [Gammaproteobacteria bacterium]